MNTFGKTNWWEAGTAILLFALGAYLAWSGFGFGIGQLNRVGAGFFPLAVGVMLMGLAVAIFIQFRQSAAQPRKLPWRPIAAIAAGLVAFALLVTTLGFVIATAVLVFVTALGDRTVHVRRAAITAIAMAVFGYVVFIVLFRLPLNPFWW